MIAFVAQARHFVGHGTIFELDQHEEIKTSGQVQSQFYIKIHRLSSQQQISLRSTLRIHGADVLSHHPRYGMVAIMTQAAAAALRQHRDIISVRKRPRRHKLHHALRRVLRENFTIPGPTKLYAMLSPFPGDERCDASGTPEVEALIMALPRTGGAASPRARAVRGCKLAVDVPPGGDVGATAAWLAAQPRVG